MPPKRNAPIIPPTIPPITLGDRSDEEVIAAAMAEVVEGSLAAKLRLEVVTVLVPDTEIPDEAGVDHQVAEVVDGPQVVLDDVKFDDAAVVGVAVTVV
jgi:hypothetical protein